MKFRPLKKAENCDVRRSLFVSPSEKYKCFIGKKVGIVKVVMLSDGMLLIIKMRGFVLQRSKLYLEVD